MKSVCSSHKRVYHTLSLAEEALLEAHQQHHYLRHSGPINVYACDLCGNFHFTSKGEMNTRLKELLASNKIYKTREAHFWESRLKKK